ncbi:AraC family transcriptional regulator [Microbaculum sp. FT89]|uniref:AraC family transcriptional regulator n=1 Tax=Microbaculum sp. FT89 TaxID=3447298 RepID=UPI003F53DAB7
MALTTREFGAGRGGESPLESMMFSRTNAFSYFDAPDKHLKIESIRLGPRGITLSRVTSSGHDVSLTEHDHFTVLLPTRGQLQVTAGSREYRAGAGQSLAFRPNSRRTRVFQAPGHDYVALVLMVPMSTIQSEPLASAIPGFAALKDDGLFLGGALAIVAALREYCEYLMACLAADVPFLRSAAALEAAEILAMEQFRSYLATVCDDDRRVIAGPARVVRKAEDFMHANYGEPLSISQIASAVGIGARSLQATFRQTLGTTPGARLASIRLEHAYRKICQGGDGRGVTEIAMACGFFHLGRFSKAYRATYGELPSETLRKSR